MKEFKINKYLSLKLEDSKTNIYIEGKLFKQCKFLMLNIPLAEVEDYVEVESIDAAAEKLGWTEEGQEIVDNEILSPEVEFWGHCSNLQVWMEMNYDTSLLHRNLAFPLLKKLTEVGDLNAKKVFKEEIAKRLASGHPNVVEYLIREGYTKYLKSEELLYSVLVLEEADILLELEKYLKIENKENLWLVLELEHHDAPCFTVHNQHVVGIDLFECGLEILPEFLSKLKFLTTLSIYSNNIEFIPISLRNLLSWNVDKRK